MFMPGGKVGLARAGETAEKRDVCFWLDGNWVEPGNRAPAHRLIQAQSEVIRRTETRLKSSLTLRHEQALHLP